MTASTPAPHAQAVDAGRPATPTHPLPDAQPQQDARLVRSWLQLWNGDHAQAAAIIAPGFRLHAAMMDGGDGGDVDSPQALVGWITSTRAAVPDLTFSLQVGPISDGDSIALRWRAQGTYSGGVPGAQAPVGTLVDFTGTDVLRTEDGRIAEYWVNSDTLLLLTQLQVRA